LGQAVQVLELIVFCPDVKKLIWLQTKLFGSFGELSLLETETERFVGRTNRSSRRNRRVQTLKTAIVVLLMMTVMYGSYVSLTTPPVPLPETVASLINESGSFELEIDAGLPESLADLGSETRPSDLSSKSPTELSLQEFAIPPSPQGPASAGERSMASFDAPAIPAITRSLSDSTSTPLGAAQGLPSLSSKEPLQLPKPDSLTSTPKIDTSRDYPTTGPSGVALPDPNSIAALPSSNTGTGWKKDTVPVSFEIPTKDGPITAQLSDSAAKTGFAMPSGVSADSTTQSPVSSAGPKEPNVGLANAIRTADRQYAADQQLEALSTLSLFYNTPDLSPADREALISRLDPLAASVIYSRQHLLEQPHRVAPNETLMEIATRYELPWQLLANINGIEDPVAVLPGTELKVLRGPFRAEVDLQRNELTIFVRDLYAGRFPISVGTEPAPQAGTYTVQDKQTARTFYDKNGSPVPPGDSRNPYGSVWMDLGKQLCIHGSPDRSAPTNQGCISLCGNDADDLVGILSQGSSVTIRR
jgi:lipoprotein-anchoring transpeptidase ErfK/SrfK